MVYTQKHHEESDDFRTGPKWPDATIGLWCGKALFLPSKRTERKAGNSDIQVQIGTVRYQSQKSQCSDALGSFFILFNSKKLKLEPQYTTLPYSICY